MGINDLSAKEGQWRKMTRMTMRKPRIFNGVCANLMRITMKKSVALAGMVIIALVCFAIYFNALYNGFVYDDEAQVLRNPWINNIKHIPEIFSGNVWQFRGMSSNYYRPLMHIAYMIDYQIFGLKPWGFHLVNILFHVGNSVLVFLIAAKLLLDRHEPLLAKEYENYQSPSPSSPPLKGGEGKEAPYFMRGGSKESPLPWQESPPTGQAGPFLKGRGMESVPPSPGEGFSSIPSPLGGEGEGEGEGEGYFRENNSKAFFPPFIAALLFATHPIHTEAVTWVAGLTEVAFAFFYLLSFYLYIKSGTGYKSYYILSVASFLIATLFKEPALTLPFVLIAYEYAAETNRTNKTYAVKRYIPYFIVAVIYFLVRSHVLGGFAPTRGDVLSMYENVINIFPLFAHYLEKLIFPFSLDAYYVFHPLKSIVEFEVIFSLFISLAFAALVYISAKKNKVAFLGLMFVVVPLLPVFYIPAVGENVFTERYLYLPSAGFALLTAMLVGRLRTAKPAVAPALSVALVLLLSFYCVMVIFRNPVWKSNYSLWADTVIKSPEGAVPHGNFGYALLSYPQRLDETIGHLETAIKIGANSHPRTGAINMSSFYNNLGIAYSEKGWEDRAIRQYQIALELNPSYVNAYNNLGVSYLESGRVKEGFQLFQTALKLQPDLAETHNNLGIAYLRMGLTDEAVGRFEEAVRLSPGDAGFYYGLADAYKAKGFYDKAEGAVRRAKGLEGGGS